MIILHDPITLRHDTVELLGAKLVPAYESPARIRAVVDSLSASHHQLQLVDLTAAGAIDEVLEIIRLNHGDEYVDHLEHSFQQWRDNGLIESDGSILPECFTVSNRANASPRPPKDIFARTGYFAFDMSTGIMKDTYDASLASANLARVAVKRLRAEKLPSIVALTRPPGHHCNGRQAGGYCYINNAAVAISTWRQWSPTARLAILDVDFHHGNGTQDIFYADPLVLYTSIHGEDEFPYYTGKVDEIGQGEAAGTTLNLPLATRSSFDDYIERLKTALSQLDAFAPEMLLISLGFDTFHLDPLGSFQIETPDYETMARAVRDRLHEIPAVILMEGGYAVEHLGANLVSFLKGWEGSSRR